MTKKLIAGNWKMNGTLASSMTLTRDIVSAVQDNPQILENNDFLICPPYLYITPVQAELTPAISLGAQDVSPFDNGAYTGDISAAMLSDMSCDYVILGHSERRQYYVESDLLVKQKASVAHENNLKTIICVGETLEQREDNSHEEIVATQLTGSIPDTACADNLVIAYEPVWAIGTGKTATIEDIETMHAFIRNHLKTMISDYQKVRILYGGSVKPTNANEILNTPNVDGALIGGASLKAEDFIGIATAHS